MARPKLTPEEKKKAEARRKQLRYELMRECDPVSMLLRNIAKDPTYLAKHGLFTQLNTIRSAIAEAPKKRANLLLADKKAALKALADEVAALEKDAKS